MIKLKKGQSFFNIAQQESSQADLMFMGIRPPREDESTESYALYYRTLLDQTVNFTNRHAVG
ncbi:MAG: hypothetical protein R3A45_03210 [Bdellovibrionota bacterium]